MKKTDKLSKFSSKNQDFSRGHHKLADLYSRNKEIIDLLATELGKIQQKEGTPEKAFKKLKDQKLTDKVILELIHNRDKFVSIPLKCHPLKPTRIDARTISVRVGILFGRQQRSFGAVPFLTQFSFSLLQRR